ncbi:MAG: hypothetical protein KJO31_18260 [Gammaproteobacteria bacterium]|nr:hypothetical protein [Gammaproteobacteria bacterium]
MLARSASSRRINDTRKACVMLALGSLMLRALIPLGYMPGNALAGEFVVLCPTGLSAELAQALHHGHHHEQSTVDMDAQCPIGTALQSAALPTLLPSPQTRTIPARFEVPATITWVEQQTERYYAIRGPPQV